MVGVHENLAGSQTREGKRVVFLNSNFILILERGLVWPEYPIIKKLITVIIYLITAAPVLTLNHSNSPSPPASIFKTGRKVMEKLGLNITLSSKTRSTTSIDLPAGHLQHLAETQTHTTSTERKRDELLHVVRSHAALRWEGVYQTEDVIHAEAERGLRQTTVRVRLTGDNLRCRSS